jgi:large subunit ribosomal protein L10
VGKEEINEILTGPNSFLFLEEDNFEALTMLNDVIKTNKSLSYKGGYINNKYLDAETIAEIAGLPSKIDLISMLLSVLQAPMRNLAYSLSQVADLKSVKTTKNEEEVTKDIVIEDKIENKDKQEESPINDDSSKEEGK